MEELNTGLSESLTELIVEDSSNEIISESSSKPPKQSNKQLTKELFKPLPAWINIINVNTVGIAYGFNCKKYDCYLTKQGVWDFKPNFKGVRMRQYIGEGFEFLGEEESVLEKY